MVGLIDADGRGDAVGRGETDGIGDFVGSADVVGRNEVVGCGDVGAGVVGSADLYGDADCRISTGTSPLRRCTHKPRRRRDRPRVAAPVRPPESRGVRATALFASARPADGSAVDGRGEGASVGVAVGEAVGAHTHDVLNTLIAVMFSN